MANDAFNQGKLAFEHNHPMSACEFPIGSSLRAEWMAGWTQASNVKVRQVPPETTASETGSSAERTAHNL